MGKKILATFTLTAALLALPASAAFAHECFIANRSASGAIHAANSGQWFTLTLEDVFAEVFSVPEANIDDAVAEALDAGLPAAISIFGRHVLAEGTGASSNGATANGRGLEHLSESPIAAALFEIAISWGGSPPA